MAVETLKLKDFIRTIPDYPKPGIMFRDITPLLGNAWAISKALDELSEPYTNQHIDKVLGTEARGWALGGALAIRLAAGFVLVRKPDKLPCDTIEESYALEYGTDRLQMHVDALEPGDSVVVHDDLIATGGTLLATVKLAQRAGAEVVGVSALLDLPDLGGSDRLRQLGLVVHSLIEFSGH
jgi:adenine phosphoribosyltransferase